MAGRFRVPDGGRPGRVDRKTARRYVAAAVAAGLDRDGGVDQLDDELIATVVAAVRPDRPQGYGSAWEALCTNHDRINKWVKDGLTVVKIGDLLARQGVVVPPRALIATALSAPSIGAAAARCPSLTESPGGVQIDFAGWAWCSIRRPGAAGWCTR